MTVATKKRSALEIHPKVAGAGIVGANVVLLLYVLSLFGVTLSPEVSAAITVDIAFLAGWLVPSPNEKPPV